MLAGVNHHAMVEGRLSRARATDEELERAKVGLADDMRQRLRDMNDWTLAAHAQEPRIIVYGSIDPVLFGDETMDELERCVAAGAQGIKVHPSIYRHFPDHPVMMQVFARCQELGLGVLSDSSSQESADGVAYGLPLGWRPVLRAFPHLKYIQAHLCGDLFDDQIELAREFTENLWFDMAGGFVGEDHRPSSARTRRRRRTGWSARAR